MFRLFTQLLNPTQSMHWLATVNHRPGQLVIANATSLTKLIRRLAGLWSPCSPDARSNESKIQRLRYAYVSASLLCCAIVTVIVLGLPGTKGNAAQCKCHGKTPAKDVGETSNGSRRRQLVNGSTTVGISTPGQRDISASHTPALTIENYTGGAEFCPSANTFTTVSNATQISLPATGNVPIGAIIGLTIGGGSQGATAVVADYGVGDESIILNGSYSNGSITIKPGDEIFLVNKGGGFWLVTSFLSQGKTGQGPSPKDSAATTDLGTHAVTNLDNTQRLKRNLFQLQTDDYQRR